MSPKSNSNSLLDMEETPCSVPIEYLDHETTDIRDFNAKYVVHHYYVRCTELADTPLPLDANPRRPEKTTQVQAMRETLTQSPRDFVSKNNGVVVLASEVKTENSVADESTTSASQGVTELNFQEGEGVCNGGHTLLAIQHYAEDPDAIVHLEVIELDSVTATNTDKRQEISEIADARNNNNQLEERSEANFLGYYDPFKQQLVNQQVVSWLEGDSDAVDKAIGAYQFFRMLKSLDVDQYGHPLYTQRGKNHSSLATSVTRIHNSWKKEMDEWKTSGADPTRRPLRYLTPLVNDVIYIRDMVSHHLRYYDYPQGVRRKGVYQQYIKSDMRDLLLKGFDHPDGFDLSGPFEVLMVGLYRTNMYLSEANSDNADLVGWFRDPETLWDLRSREILEELQNDFKDGDKDAKSFIRLNGPFTHDFYIHGMSSTVSESPAIVYRIGEQGSRYEQTDSEQNATHELITHKDPEKSDSLVPIENGSGDGTYMRQYQLKNIFKFVDE